MTPTVSSRSRGVVTLVLAAAVVLGASGCGDDAEPTGPDESSSPSPSESESTTEATETATETASEPATPEGQVIDITIADGKVDPSGERVDAKVGEELTLRITSDAADELHVHSTPEQVVPFGVGTTIVPLTLDRPGVVDVELHELEIVIVQLEVR